MNTTVFGLSKKDALHLAKKRANDSQKPFEVWEHVGDYGRPGGDIPARHTYRVVTGGTDLPRDWAMVACVDPEGN